MSSERTLILDHQSIITKLERMACEICEKHSEETGMIVCGMNSRGFFIAKALVAQIQGILPNITIQLVQINTQHNSTPEFNPHIPMMGKRVLLVDDVINTGKTLMFVLQTIFSQDPECIETAFLAKREHRNYPVKADYVGISLATTLQEHVVFDNNNPSGLEVYLN